MLFVALLLAIAADSGKQQESVNRQQTALEKQRASVRRQAPGDTSGFFTTGWMDERQPIPAPNVEAPCEPLPAEHIRKLIIEAATKQNLNPLLLRAIIGRESGGRPCAVSPKGAQGLMQLMPGTAAALNVSDALDPAENVAAGAQYLRQLLDRYKGDLRLALAAYNAGPQRVDGARTVPQIAETQAYVSAILAALSDPESSGQ